MPLTNSKLSLNILLLSIVSVLLVLVGIFVFSSTVSLNDKVHAENTNSTISVGLNEVLTISVPGTITLTGCNPTAMNLCTADADIVVSSNVENGYKLYMNAAEGASTSLNHSSVAAAVSTLDNQYTTANFPVNAWGYTGGTDQTSHSGYNCALNYCPVLAYQSDPTSYSPNRLINYAYGPVAPITNTVTFGAKVNNSKPSGTYTTSVVFTAIGNVTPQIIKNGMNIQDIDAEVCNNTQTINTTYTVVDSRDGTEYTVAKLADNKCWMTSNLELGEYGTPMNLTDQLSNVGPDGYTLTLPFANSSVYKGNSNHYGNFYNWDTATAGSGTNTEGEDAPYSTCPKNWRLPRTTTVHTDSEFYTLLKDNYITTGTWNNDGYWTDVTTSQFLNVPVSLVFSGGIGSNGTLYDQGSNGNWWSSTSNGPSYAFSLYVDTNGYIHPRTNYYQSYGFSIRCLVDPSQ